MNEGEEFQQCMHCDKDACESCLPLEDGLRLCPLDHSDCCNEFRYPSAFVKFKEWQEAQIDSGNHACAYVAMTPLQ